MVSLMRLQLFAAFSVLQQTLGQTWCNKHYMYGSPVVPPGGQFPILDTSVTPLLAFRCTPIFKPYLEEDAPFGAALIIDTPFTYTKIKGAEAITLAESTKFLHVAISIESTQLAQAIVPLNTTKFEVPFPLLNLKPQMDPYTISCTATYSNDQVFKTSTLFSFLPNPTAGSVTKMDSRTGALLNKAVGSPHYTTVFPLGFYTYFGGYLDKNLSILNDLKDRGINIIHPVPTFDNITALNAVLDRMDELGLYLVYDMRHSYTNLTSVAGEVASIKSRKSLLLWYTADEPDGWGDPLNATSLAYEKIYSVDGGYHPVSLVLNCENYDFEPYTAGTDIVMQDTYMIGINATYSVEWNTPCTPDYGDCGCDNCVGKFEDISIRMDEFKERLWALGWDRTKAVWAVSQAFSGDGDYWSRVPTGREWIVQSILGINHGGLGIVPWNDPTTADIKSAATLLAHSLVPYLVKFTLNPKVTFKSYISDRIDVGLWTVGIETLIIATNLNYVSKTLKFTDLPGGFAGNVRQVMDSGATIFDNTVVFESVGSGAFLSSSW